MEICSWLQYASAKAIGWRIFAARAISLSANHGRRLSGRRTVLSALQANGFKVGTFRVVQIKVFDAFRGGPLSYSGTSNKSAGTIRESHCRGLNISKHVPHLPNRIAAWPAAFPSAIYSSPPQVSMPANDNTSIIFSTPGTVSSECSWPDSRSYGVRRHLFHRLELVSGLALRCQIYQYTNARDSLHHPQLPSELDEGQQTPKTQWQTLPKSENIFPWLLQHCELRHDSPVE